LTQSDIKDYIRHKEFPEKDISIFVTIIQARNFKNVNRKRPISVSDGKESKNNHIMNNMESDKHH
jgi:hypothetical protein